MNSPTSVTHALGFKLKRIHAQNSSLTPTIHELHATMTPKQTKTLSFIAQNAGLSYLSPEYACKVDSYRAGSCSPLPEDLVESPKPKKVIKLHKRSLKNLANVSENQSPKVQDHLEIKLMSSLRRESKAPQPFSPKGLGNISSLTPSNRSSSKKKMLASIVGNRTNGFAVTPAGQILKRLPLKDEDFGDSSIRLQFQDIPNGNSYRPQPPSPHNPQIKGLNRSLDFQEENGRSTPAVMSQILYTPKGSSTTTNKPKIIQTPSLLNQKNRSLKSWGEVKMQKTLLASKDASDIVNDVNSTMRPDIKEISQVKLKLKFPETHRDRSCMEIGKHCERLDRRSGKRMGENLSPDSQYNYQDTGRYIAAQGKKGQELKLEKLKFREGDLECWMNVALKYGGEANILTKKGEKLHQRIIQRQRKDNIVKELFNMRNRCKEVINYGDFTEAETK